MAIKKIKEKKGKSKISKTAQQAIPYEAIYGNGIIEIKKGQFCKSYFFGDADFKTESEDKQEALFDEYQNLLNKFGSEIIFQITIFNRNTDIEKFKKAIFFRPQRDDLNDFREEYNSILESKMQEGRNDIIRERYLTVTINSKDIVSAVSTFNNIDYDVDEAFKKINKKGVKPLSTTERLEILFNIYNMNAPISFRDKIKGFLDENGELDLKKLKKSGLKTKDLICSDNIKRNFKDLELGDVFSRTFSLDNLPTFLNTDILSEITSLPCNMLTSLLFKTTPQKKAARLIKNQITNINADLIKHQKKAVEGNYDASLISPDISLAKEEADLLLKDVLSRNQKLFFVSILITIFAGSEKELDSLTESLMSKTADFLCHARRLDAQQVAGFNTSLPLATLHTKTDRSLTTESAAVFFPFSMNEIMDTGGIYYGLNAVSKNMIINNRVTSDLPNGVILGRSGSGKSFIAKTEIVSTYLGSDADIIIIDPEEEYLEIANRFGGQVIHINPGTNTHVNPLDFNINYADKDDPISMKCDFLVTLCETMLGKVGLSSYDVSVIHRCGRRILERYVAELKDKGDGSIIDRKLMPTLKDFYNELMDQPESYAKALALGIEPYAIGNYDLFASRTNVNTDSRFIVYNIKNTGSGSKELAMQVCLNDIWNRITENKNKNKTTWIYLDEFYLLTQTQSSATFLQQIFKRARKWGGIMTGITQDIEDLLITPEARGIVNNCGFLLMMNQSPLGRAELQELYKISTSLLGFITDKPPGTGLLYNGTTIAPFENKFPKDTELYRLLSTKAKEE